MSAISPNQFTILESLKDGPRWARSFQSAKPLVADLIDRGVVERCRPPLGRARNMLRLTDAGCAALEIAPDSVPAQREPEQPLEPKRFPVGQVKPSAKGTTRRDCETFLRDVARGQAPRDVIGYLAERQGAKRTTIIRRLRAGGAIPEGAAL